MTTISITKNEEWLAEQETSLIPLEPGCTIVTQYLVDDATGDRYVIRLENKEIT